MFGGRQWQRGLDQCLFLPSLKHSKISQGGQDASSQSEVCTLCPSLNLRLGLGSLIKQGQDILTYDRTLLIAPPVPQGFSHKVVGQAVSQSIVQVQ